MKKLFALLLFLLALALTAVAGAATTAGDASDTLPFHSEIAIHQIQYVPIPAGRCTEPPEGLSYLFLARGNGTHTSTHLGAGPFRIEHCVYGLLTDPGAPPPANGIPMGYDAGERIFTAANGDQLLGTAAFIGFTAPPPTPGWQFIESLTFLDGGTGRFEFAEGTGQCLIDNTDLSAVCDGWIRYGKTDK